MFGFDGFSILSKTLYIRLEHKPPVIILGVSEGPKNLIKLQQGFRSYCLILLMDWKKVGGHTTRLWLSDP